MSLALLLASLLAGMMSVLAPCVISMIPAFMSRGVDGRRARSPLFVIGGLAVSIFVFSILLKSSTLLLNVPSSFWSALSGTIVILFGVTMVFPGIWEKAVLATGFNVLAQRNLASSSSERGWRGDILLGASLGPVFSACSPTYALIVASILPAEPIAGVAYLLAYVAGLSLLMWLIVVFGRSLIVRLGWGINPESWFHRILGILLIVVGFMILTGLDKALIAYLVSAGLFDWQIELEELLQR